MNVRQEHEIYTLEQLASLVNMSNMDELCELMTEWLREQAAVKRVTGRPLSTSLTWVVKRDRPRMSPKRYSKPKEDK